MIDIFFQFTSSTNNIQSNFRSFFLRSDHVVLGEYDTKTNPDCDEDGCAKPVQNIKIAQVFMPKTWDGENYWNDIIVVKLEHPADLNGNRILSP